MHRFDRFVRGFKRELPLETASKAIAMSLFIFVAVGLSMVLFGFGTDIGAEAIRGLSSVVCVAMGFSVCICGARLLLGDER